MVKDEIITPNIYIYLKIEREKPGFRIPSFQIPSFCCSALKNPLSG
jgi:hypothetical protein